MLSSFLVFEKYFKLLRCQMLTADWFERGVEMLWIAQLENAPDSKALHINVQQSFEIVHTRQELQLRIRQSINVYKRS